MGDAVSRRGFLVSGVAVPFAAAAGLGAEGAEAADGGTLAVFPSHPPELVKETVIVAHGNVKRLREIVDERPALARAAWDWGFGDWEDALGAASHVGNREIAEYLIAHGARPTLFSATMLGQLEVVKTFLAAQPGAQRIPGPHSISLLSHARAGGPAADEVRRYLESLGDADSPSSSPLSDEEKLALAGGYLFGAGATERIDITVDRGGLMFTRNGTFARGLIHVGNLEFHPAGATAARVKFSADRKRLTVIDGALTLTAERAKG